jgi:hypothetical protein
VIVGPLIPPGVGPVLIAVLVACLTTRWVAPLVLRMLARSIQTTVAMVATLMIFPEYCVSSASRRRHLDPPQLAYDYGAAVGWLAYLIHRTIGWLFRHLAAAIRAIPLALVAMITGGLTIGWLLGLITV